MSFITKSEVSEIRKELKKVFPEVKFSVTGANSSKVTVAVMSSPLDFSEFEKPYVSNINYRDLEGKKSQKFFDKILNIIHTAPGKAEGGQEWFDKSDSMTDYFHTAFYIDISIGKWDKAYNKTEKKRVKVAAIAA